MLACIEITINSCLQSVLGFPKVFYKYWCIVIKHIFYYDDKNNLILHEIYSITTIFIILV